MKKILQKLFLFALISQALSSEKTSAQIVVGVDTLINHGNKNNRINLVFLGDGYTSSQQSQFNSDVLTIVNKLFITAPFNRYQNFFNVYAIHVVSAESGADHPHTASDCASANPQVPATTVNTALGATFDYGGIHRLLYCTNITNITSILNSYTPFFDKGMIVVNSPYYGGSGGIYPTCSVEANSAEIMIHELGHSFAALGDEYGGTSCGGTEKPNCTTETNASLVKWKSWFPNGIPIPTPPGTNCSSIGLYLGANYCNTTWYRPKCNCKMNQLNNPFCEVCAQELIYCINNGVNLIESVSPSTSTGITLGNGQSQTFNSTVVAPTPNSLLVLWKLDNNIGGINTSTFTVDGTSLTTGTHTLVLTVSDTTSLSKKTMPQYTASWTITKTGVTVTLNPFNPVCSNASAFTLTGGSPAGGTYSGTGVSNGTFNPAVAGAGTFNITYTYSGSSATQPITVNPQPNVTVSANATICSGSSTTLNAGGATTYTWSPSIALNLTTGASINANPTSNQAYTVTGTTNGCTKSATTFVFVNSIPIVNVSGASSICSGSSTNLTASGATTYSWSPSSSLNQSSGATVLASPTVNTTYTIIGSNNGCNGSATKVIIMNTKPVISVSTVPTSCPSSSDGTIDITITPSGQTLTYLWSNGNSSQDLLNMMGGNYSVTVTNSLGCSSYKSTAVTAPACSGVIGITISNINSSSATVNWNANNCAAIYKLRRKATTEPNWKYVEVNAATFSKTYSNLAPGKTYEVQMMSYCNSSKTDSSGFSSSIYFNTLNTCISATNTIASTITGTSAILNWSGSAEKFILRWRVSGGTWHLVTVSGNLNQYTLTNLSPNTTYQWTIKSICDSVANDFSAFTGAKYFTTLSSSKIENASSLASDWKIFPNPTTDKIYFSIENSQHEKISVVLNDIFGKEILRKEISNSSDENEIDISNYGAGIYFIQIKSESGTQVKRIIKQ